MPLVATTGAMCACTCGSCPSSFTSTPSLSTCEGLPIGTIFDNIPGLNFKNFGTCTILSGAPCAPVTLSPWILVKPNLAMLNKKPILTIDSKLTCTVGGIIQFIMPAKFTCNLK